MLTTSLIGAAVVIVIIARLMRRRSVERCPDCDRPRESDHPICECGWVFEYPDDGAPLEYGDPDTFENR